MIYILPHFVPQNIRMSTGKSVSFFRHQESFHHPFTFPIHFYQNNPSKCPVNHLCRWGNLLTQSSSWANIICSWTNKAATCTSCSTNTVYFSPKTWACFKMKWGGLTVAALGYKWLKKITKSINFFICVSYVADFCQILQVCGFWVVAFLQKCNLLRCYH